MTIEKFKKILFIILKNMKIIDLDINIVNKNYNKQTKWKKNWKNKIITRILNKDDYSDLEDNIDENNDFIEIENEKESYFLTNLSNLKYNENLFYKINFIINILKKKDRCVIVDFKIELLNNIEKIN